MRAARSGPMTAGLRTCFSDNAGPSLRRAAASRGREPAYRNPPAWHPAGRRVPLFGVLLTPVLFYLYLHPSVAEYMKSQARKSALRLLEAGHWPQIDAA